MARWLSGELDEIERLRDQDKLPWAEIAFRFGGRSRSQVTSAYHNRKRQRERAADRVTAALASGATALQVVARAAAGDEIHPQLEGAMRRQSLEALRDWTELCARIAERGLTGGVLGEPPPGRSALDERTRGFGARLQRPASGGVRDVG